MKAPCRPHLILAIGSLLVAVLAAACAPLSSSPITPTQPTPVISDFAPTGPTVAGQPITVQARVTRPGGVEHLDWDLKGPDASLIMDDPAKYCTDLHETTNGPADDFIATLTCTLPSSAPNGKWNFFLTAGRVGVVYDFKSVDFTLTGGHQVIQLLSQSVEPAVFPSGSTFTLTATVSSEQWILYSWYPVYSIPTTPVAGVGPPCVTIYPITPTNDGTWRYECDSTGMAPGIYHLSANWIPADYTGVEATWEFQVT